MCAQLQEWGRRKVDRKKCKRKEVRRGFAVYETICRADFQN
jgi:hypothetical protein